MTIKGMYTFAEAREQGVVDWSDFSTMKQITCVNHPTARYLSKNPSQRGLHFVKPCEEAPQEGWPVGGLECPCEYGDLRVIVTDEYDN